MMTREDSGDRDHVVAVNGAGRHAIRPEELPVSDGLHGLVEQQAARRPSQVAVVHEGLPRTYADLNADANRLAHRLRSLGVVAESPVAVSLHRGYDLIVTLLGVLKAGGVYLPVPPELPVERAAFMVEDTAARVFVTETGTVLAGASEQSALSYRVIIDSPDHARAVQQMSAENPSVPLGWSNAAYIIYTSGSTGRPKGVVVTHGNVLRLFEVTAPQFAFGPGDVWTFFHSYAFDFSVWEIWGALVHGGRLVVVTGDVTRTPQKLLELLDSERVTVLNQTPSAFAALSDVLEDDRARARRLSLRAVILGGEALNCSAAAKWMDLFGDEGPDLINMYGITETTVHVTHKRLSRADLQECTEGDGTPIGRPIDDLRIHLLDPQLRVVPPGEPGEMYVAGPGLARGYLNRSGLTAGRFLPDIAGVPGERMYRTGDRARMSPDGELRFLGRVDDQVKIRGFRIEVGEVESALSACADVDAAAVVASLSPTGDAVLAGYVVPRKGTGADPGRWRAQLVRRLPDYMIPSVLVSLTSMPLTPNGKVDRAALAQLDRSALRAAPGRVGADGGCVQPGTKTERYLVGLWRDLLGADEISVTDDFFKLGGHSLLAVRAQRRIRRDLGVNLDFAVMFENGILKDLAGRIAAQQSSQ